MRKATLSATERQTSWFRSYHIGVVTDYKKTEGLTLSAVRLCLLLPLLLLELHVPIMHHSTCQLVDGEFFFTGEAQDVSGSLLKEKQSADTL